MSLFATLNTSISGMAAQATKLSTIGDNIANSSTTGYKKAGTEFETLLGNEATSEYQSGGVKSVIRYGVSEQGLISSTTSTTDLAVSGNGFFVVQDTAGGTVLTRAGSFVPDAAGNLINSAGYKLMGYSVADGSTALSAVNVNSQALAASASTGGTLSVNLPSTALAVAAASLPSTNAGGATFTSKTSLTAYDNLGTAVTLDVYLTKTADNTWEAAVYNKANAAAGGGFPYSSAAMTTQTLSFDAATGKLAAASPASLSVAIPNGNTVAIDMSKSTQLATGFQVAAGIVDGSSPSKLDHITIAKDGTVTAVYANGITQATYKIPLATVVSPDNLTPLVGNAYAVNGESGAMIIGTANAGGLGEIDSSSLEGSTVDLATELTSMISAQRGYEANSKVLQTTSDLLKVLNNLQV